MVAQTRLAFAAGIVTNVSTTVAAHSGIAGSIMGHATTAARQQPASQEQEAARKSLEHGSFLSIPVFDPHVPWEVHKDLSAVESLESRKSLQLINFPQKAKTPRRALRPLARFPAKCSAIARRIAGPNFVPIDVYGKLPSPTSKVKMARSKGRDGSCDWGKSGDRWLVIGDR
jgi:hypothetical protein